MRMLCIHLVIILLRSLSDFCLVMYTSIHVQCSSVLSCFKFATMMMVEATCPLLSASVFVV